MLITLYFGLVDLWLFFERVLCHSMTVPEKSYLFRVVVGSGAGCGEDLQLECFYLLCFK